MGKVFFKPRHLSESHIALDNERNLEIASYQRLKGQGSFITGAIKRIIDNPEMLNKLSSIEQDEFFTELGVIERIIRKIF